MRLAAKSHYIVSIIFPQSSRPAGRDLAVPKKQPGSAAARSSTWGRAKVSWRGSIEDPTIVSAQRFCLKRSTGVFLGFRGARDALSLFMQGA